MPGALSFKSNPVATTYTDATGALTSNATINISAVNLGANTNIRIAVGENTTPSNSEFIEYNLSLFTSEVVERSAIVITTGERVVVYSESGDVAFRIHGYYS